MGRTVPGLEPRRDGVGTAEPRGDRFPLERINRSAVCNVVTSLVVHLRDDWHDLQQGRPGRRFQDRYDRAAHARNSGSWLKRAAKVTVGVVALVIGIAEVVLPGPAFLFIALGGAVLATQWRIAAVAMDWCEVNLRAVARFALSRWRSASVPLRIFVVAAMVVAAAVGAYLIFRRFAG